MDSDSTDMVLLFNILHADNPVALLKEAFRILKPGAVTAIIHWNYDPSTPRGPRMEIRPKPDQVLAWAAQAGFAVPASAIPVACFHYGFLATKLDS
jgi:predicted methyltransferase